MSSRTVIIALACFLFANATLVSGVWLWSRSQMTNDAPTEAHEKVPPAPEEVWVVKDVPVPAPVAAPVPRVATPVPAPVIATVSPPRPSDAPNFTISIDSPHEGDSVPRKFKVSGRCGPLPAGQRLMLVVDSGRNIYSPKLPPVTVDGENWSGTVNEYGAPTGAPFSVCVFQVSEAGVEELRKWQVKGNETGLYPPYRVVPGGVYLTRINLRVVRPVKP